jgi:hypothetical protein
LVTRLLAGVGTNGILESRFLPKNADRTIITDPKPPPPVMDRRVTVSVYDPADGTSQ